MIKSTLTNVVLEAHPSNYTQGRNGYKICKITPHHMAGVLSAEGCAEIFQNPSKNASSNYGIGNDGKIACYVGEENRAWTSSSKLNDCQAITIEVSNCENGGQWKVSEAAWNSLVNLCVDICKRYGFRLTYDGTPNGSLTRHNMFWDTACPGPYLQSRFQELADIVNTRLDGNVTTKYKVGDNVTINGVYVSSASINKLTPAVTKGTITKVIAGARNPYLLNDGAIGWVNDGCIVVETKTTTKKPSKSIETLAKEVIKGEWGNGEERKKRLTEAGYDYAKVQAKVNALLK